MNIIKQIKSLPYWIRFTEYCPLKRMGFQTMPFTDQPTTHVECRTYFAFMFAFAPVSNDLRKYIKEAVAFVIKEKSERDTFQEIYREAPLSIRDRFPRDVYQTAAGRNCFFKAIVKLAGRIALPEGFGVRNFNPKYHKARNTFRISKHTTNNTYRSMYVQVRNPYVPIIQIGQQRAKRYA